MTFHSAVGFCYFETLLYLGNKQKWLEEQTRLRSLDNLLQAVGLSRDIYEDWEDETLDLLRAIANLSPVEGEAELMTAFNEGGSWQSIITYLKVPSPCASALVVMYSLFSASHQCLDTNTAPGLRALHAGFDRRAVREPQH
ncbi:MAG: hypothetical protein INR71_11790 [Terriglobus roseus]|nr:hypothetical protein [Terriglobus roseus]